MVYGGEFRVLSQLHFSPHTITHTHVGVVLRNATESCGLGAFLDGTERNVGGERAEVEQIRFSDSVSFFLLPRVHCLRYLLACTVATNN